MLDELLVRQRLERIQYDHDEAARARGADHLAEGSLGTSTRT